MKNRSLRRLVALLGILGLSFAQFAAAANACGLGAFPGHERSAVSAHVALSAGPEAQHHCGGHSPAPTPALPGSNLCEVHCSDPATPVAAPDVPAVTLAVLPVPVVPLAALAAAPPPPTAETLARAAAPPIVIAFGRLLI